MSLINNPNSLNQTEVFAPDTDGTSDSHFSLPEEAPNEPGSAEAHAASSMPLSGRSAYHRVDGLDVATAAGEILLANGAEIFRVQDTMNRILKVYETAPFNVFVISNAIMANVERGGQAKSAVVRYIPLGPNHLGRVTKVNSISRSITAGQLSCEEAMAALQEVRGSDDTTLRFRAFATSIASAGFAFLSGGSWIDFAVTLFTSFVLSYFMALMNRFAVARIMMNMLGACFVSALVLIILKIELLLGLPPLNYSAIIIGSIMQLVPGMSLVTAVREALNTDYLSGAIRLIDVLTLAFGIATGVAASFWILGPLLGGIG